MIEVSKDARKFDAQIILKRFKRKYLGIKFEVRPLSYQEKAFVVFVDEKYSWYRRQDKYLFNGWNRNSFGKDGINLDFYKWITKQGLKASWYSKVIGPYDGIEFVPKDFNGLYKYYNCYTSPKPRIQKPEDKVEIDKVIQLFDEVTGLKGYEPHNFYSSPKDRYIINCKKDEIIVQFYLMKDGPIFNMQNQVNRTGMTKLLQKYEHAFQRHKDVILEMYDKLKHLAVGELWYMEGGGGQIQAFYGDDRGYMGILYLDMRYEEPVKIAKRREFKWTFQINNRDLDKSFNGFSSPNIKIHTVKRTFGYNMFD